VEVRDEEWLVTGVQTVYERATHQEVIPSRPVQRIEVQGLSELVRDTSAVFFDSIDTVTPIDSRQAPLINDPSSGYRDAKLWLEATLMKTATAVEDTNLTVADGMLIDAKEYQQTPVRKILDPQNLRPRILLADAVGLGKTIEIGLILAELIKRGRGDRILVVTPKHVLEQMQHEMWTKFAIPFVRLDSQGIQRIRQKLPATRNPFTYFKRAIISIDTLKSDRYLAHLRRHKWDAVVIDESHNVTNTSSLNHRLADTLAKNTDALILASATPHNGKKDAAVWFSETGSKEHSQS
jgi:type I site-specific restriction endonuclease